MHSWDASSLDVIDYAELAGCDLVIEAVFESRAVKAEVTQQGRCGHSAKSAIFASNTSTLPITSLAATFFPRLADFIGLHFFSPVDKTPLAEMITGRDTGPATLARAMDYVAQIRKTPIAVNDSPGFYTSRVFATYFQEGILMLGEAGLRRHWWKRCAHEVCRSPARRSAMKWDPGNRS